MNTYEEDPTFTCRHLRCKKIINTSWLIMDSTKVKEITIGPFDILDTDIVFDIQVNHKSPWKSLHRFAYPDPNSNTITVPLVSDSDMFLAPHTTLFTLCGVDLQQAWKILVDEEIFYSDDDDDDDDVVDEEEEEEEEEVEKEEEEEEEEKEIKTENQTEEKGKKEKDVGKKEFFIKNTNGSIENTMHSI